MARQKQLLNPKTKGLIARQAVETPPAATNQPKDEPQPPPPAETGAGLGPVFQPDAVHPRLIGAENATAPQPTLSRLQEQRAETRVEYATPHLTQPKQLDGAARFHLPEPPDVRSRSAKT